ncbi:MAG: divergent polysaccharide deacetylase family protein [Candidatus Eremiobacteraeota bacterium]|nr:divergent polysaccharide deacetylase family protein [Candidatus Eremiobacteraeota bacterium]
MAIAGGFADGRALQPAGAASLAEQAAQPVTIVPPDVMPPSLPRGLHGARSGQGWFDPPEPALDAAVAARPSGWAPAEAPNLRDTVKLAIVVRGTGEDRTLDKQFASIPYPLTFAVSAADDVESLAVGADPRATLIDADPPVAPEKVVATLRRLGARGVLTALAGRSTSAHALAALLAGSDALVVDGMAQGRDDAYRAARALREPALTRDVWLDQRDEESYVSFMIRQAVHLARRTGVAVAVCRADPHTFDALRRTLPTLENDAVEVVPIGDLTR